MREWLITNGLGSYAASTDLGGLNTRRYHGLLVASLTPPSNRHLILSKVDESIEINGKIYNLYTNALINNISEGYLYQKDFEKEIIPIFKYDIGEMTIEKSICMIYGKNAVVVNYKIQNKNNGAKLKITPIVNSRNFHSLKTDTEFEYNRVIDENRTQLNFENLRINMGVKGSIYRPYNENIFKGMYYKKEEDRGFDSVENHLVPGTFEIYIEPNERKEVTFICSLEGRNGIDYNDILKIDSFDVITKEYKRISKLIENSNLLDIIPPKAEKINVYNDIVRRFIVASDNFIVKRQSNMLTTVIAGYPWFLDWGRDTLIAFEGLFLMTNRIREAEETLLTYVKSTRRGIIPNGFSEYDDIPLFNSVDASLLFFNAVGKYLDYTNNYRFVMEKLFEKMRRIIKNYIDGISLDGNNIYLDKKDYLINSGTHETQNTWMDAKVNGKPVTPRNGKAVEINALWYNALQIMRRICIHENKLIQNIEYKVLATRCKKSFEKKFYNEEISCFVDVLGNKQIRPNQLFAMSLSYPIVNPTSEIGRKSFVTCTQKLLNRYGLRTLDQSDENYIGQYVGGPLERDMAYHQGTTWPWLFGLYYDSLKNMIRYERKQENKEALQNTLEQFKLNVAETFLKEIVNGNTVGSISEIYDGTDPKDGKGAFAQAWSVSEIFKILLTKE